MATITSSTNEADPGQPVTFSCPATGVGANSFVYGWLLNGNPVKRRTMQALMVAASEDTAGDYQCTVRNRFKGFGRSTVVRLTLSKCAMCCLVCHYNYIICFLDRFCDPVTVRYTGFNVTWNRTRVGRTVEAPCTGPELNGNSRPFCEIAIQWSY